jgi:hypothetical protein
VGGAARTSALGALVVLGVSFEFVAVIGEGSAASSGTGTHAALVQWRMSRRRSVSPDCSGQQLDCPVLQEGDSSPAGQYPASQICEVEGIPPCRYVAGC